MSPSKRIITGIKPTNHLHIGNYIGAIKQIKELANQDYDIFMFVPDLHALTDEHELTSIFYVMKVYLSTCPSNITYYIQSEHLEIPYIAWFLSCCTPVGQLKRMTQFKSKESDFINSGYLFYPILMAADILSIDADIVPVGIDQKQHIELTRDIVDYFNNKFKINIFKKPEPRIIENSKIMSLQDPSKKMSKSDENLLSTIFLTDRKEDIEKKVQKAVTDQFLMPINILEIKETRPGIFNLCNIYKEISNKSFEYIEQTFGNQYTSIFKKALSEELFVFLNDLQIKMNEISKKDIARVLEKDKVKISEILSSKVKLLKNLIKDN